MDNTTTWFIAIGIVLIAFVWEIGRRIWYWTAAKVLGWSEQEKFERETAWLDRAAARDERHAAKDKWAASNVERRRSGVVLTTLAIAMLAFQLDLPWWNAAVIILLAYVGTTMTAGLAFKAW
jgi:hypothetical protein